MLRRFGLDIEMCKSKTVGYYIASRKFEMPELKLLVDAVQRSRSITQKKSTNLISKLTSLTSNHQARQLRGQVLSAYRPKSMNECVYYSVDAIHSGIVHKKKISFRYFDYNLDKHKIYRRAGKRYCQTPIALHWSDDKYYLICYSAKYDGFVNFRVDRMSDVSVCDESVDIVDTNRFNVSEYTRQVFGMYAGKVVRAVLLFDKCMVNAVIDRFGSEVKFYRDGDCFRINVEVSGSPAFLSWIIQFGDKAKILSPDSLRESMHRLISKLNSIYYSERV